MGTGSISLLVQTCSGAIVDSCFGRAQASRDVNLLRIVSFEGRTAWGEKLIVMATSKEKKLQSSRGRRRSQLMQQLHMQVDVISPSTSACHSVSIPGADGRCSPYLKSVRLSTIYNDVDSKEYYPSSSSTLTQKSEPRTGTER